MTSPDLQSILDTHDFIQLTNSRDRYPNHSGSGVPLLCIDTPLCTATIALQGAQLLEFTPKNSSSLLWLSPKCHFEPGNSLRGGVPICLPWFSTHPTDNDKPSHGFARNQEWSLEHADIDDERVELIFSLQHINDALFPHTFNTRLTLRLNASAEIILELHNTGETTFETSWAFHNYLPVNDIATAKVVGLEGKIYADKVQGFAQCTQIGEVTFAGQVDRVFENLENFVSIESQNNIEITHYNCPSVIVWNPGAKLASKMSDIGADNERGFLCLERGAVCGDTWKLDPLEHRSAWIRISQS